MVRYADSDIRPAIDKVVEAAVNATKWFGDFADGFIACVLERAWGDSSEWNMVGLPLEAPQFDDVRIPWFTAE